MLVSLLIFFLHPVFLDAPPQPAVAIKEEVMSRAGSEQGEEEMEVDSADEQEEESRGQGGPARSQVSKSNNTGATFNTLSSLGSLRPGIMCVCMYTHTNKCLVNVSSIITGTSSLVDCTILFQSGSIL